MPTLRSHALAGRKGLVYTGTELYPNAGPGILISEGGSSGVL